MDSNLFPRFRVSSIHGTDCSASSIYLLVFSTSLHNLCSLNVYHSTVLSILLTSRRRELSVGFSPCPSMSSVTVPRQSAPFFSRLNRYLLGDPFRSVSRQTLLCLDSVPVRSQCSYSLPTLPATDYSPHPSGLPPRSPCPKPVRLTTSRPTPSFPESSDGGWGVTTLVSCPSSGLPPP